MMFNLKDPEDVINELNKKISNKSKTAFISALVVGILTHIYLFTNNIFNSDGVLTGPYQGGYLWELSIGRWALEYFSKISTGFTLPVVIGIISILCLSMVSVIITNIFEFKNNINIVILSCIIVTFPSITATFGFIFIADVYMIAYLLATLSVYIIYRNNNLKGIIWSAIILAVSMGIYQAYVGVAMMLCLILLILSSVNDDIKQFVKKIFNYIMYGILGTTIYFIILKIFLKIKDVELSSYRGVDEIGKISINNLPYIVKDIYIYFYEFLFTKNIYYNSDFRMFLYSVILLLCGVLVGLMMKNSIYRNYKKAIGTIILLAQIPLVAGIMRILAPNTTVSTLMIPQFALVFILPLIFLEKVQEYKLINVIKWITTISCALLSFNYFLLANISYLNLQLQYEKAYSLANRITDRIETDGNYIQGMQIAFMGSLESGNYKSVIPAEKEVLKGIDCIDYDYPFYANETRSLTAFINDYIGVNFQYTSKEKIDEIVKTHEFKQMNNYPSKESIKIIDNIIVVKLSDM